MGYLFVLLAALMLVPLILLATRRGTAGGSGEKTIGKPVMLTEPSADAPTPAASSIAKNPQPAQRHTPPA